jgi:hypothetical protein
VRKNAVDSESGRNLSWKFAEVWTQNNELRREMIQAEIAAEAQTWSYGSGRRECYLKE